jgi:hypothetical protein
MPHGLKERVLRVRPSVLHGTVRLYVLYSTHWCVYAISVISDTVSSSSSSLSSSAPSNQSDRTEYMDQTQLIRLNGSTPRSARSPFPTLIIRRNGLYVAAKTHCRLCTRTGPTGTSLELYTVTTVYLLLFPGRLNRLCMACTILCTATVN